MTPPNESAPVTPALHTVRSGPPGAPAVLLLHGGGLSSWSWQEQRPALHGWWMILLITLLTTVGSIGLGLVFGRLLRVPAATAAMGRIAGGSAGIVATSDSLGADPRLVTYMQYLRLVLVVLATPVVVKLMGGQLHFVGNVDPEVGGTAPGPCCGTPCAAWTRSAPCLLRLKARKLATSPSPTA